MLSSCLCCLQLTNTIIDIVQQAANYKQLRKGANEGKPCNTACRTGPVLASPHADILLCLACSHQNAQQGHL